MAMSAKGANARRSAARVKSIAELGGQSYAARYKQGRDKASSLTTGKFIK